MIGRINLVTRTIRVLRLKPASIVFVITSCCFAISAQLHAFPTTPPRVRFTGVLLPMGEQSRKGLLEDLDVTIGKEKWTFFLDHMEVIGGIGFNRPILQRIFPPSLHVVGPDRFICVLKSPNTLGKVVTLEGLLYTDSRLFFLIAIDGGETACAPKNVERRASEDHLVIVSE